MIPGVMRTLDYCSWYDCSNETKLIFEFIKYRVAYEAQCVTIQTKFPLQKPIIVFKVVGSVGGLIERLSNFLTSLGLSSWHTHHCGGLR